MAARLAASGFTGPAGAIDGQFGLLDVVAGAHKRPERLDANLGEDFEILHTTVKIYPCCAVLQSTLEAVLRLRQDHGLRGDNLVALAVGASARAVTQNNERNPADLMAAQYSLPFCAALALRDDPEDPRLFTTAALTDPAIRVLMQKVEMHVDDRMQAAYPRSMGARVAATLSDGRRIETEVLDAHGTALAPCTPSELEAKFRRLASLAIGADAAAGVLEAIGKIKAGASVATLSRALRKAPEFA